MIDKVFEDVAPYISNIKEIREFVEEHRDAGEEELIEILNEKIENSQGTLKTDYRILLNEVSKRINMER